MIPRLISFNLWKFAIDVFGDTSNTDGLKKYYYHADWRWPPLALESIIPKMYEQNNPKGDFHKYKWGKMQPIEN